jgi:hypothetical protein
MEEKDKEIGFAGIGRRIRNLKDEITPEDKAAWKQTTEKPSQAKPDYEKLEGKPKKYAPQRAGFPFRLSFAKVFWAFIAIVIIASIFSQNENKKTNYTTGNPTPMQSSFPSSVDEEVLTDGQYRCTQDHHNRAEELKPSTSEMQEIERQQRILNSEEDALVLLKKQIETDYVDHYSQSSVDKHNMLIENYNSRLQLFRINVQNLDRRIDNYNAQVNNYNNYLMTNCRKEY